MIQIHPALSSAALLAESNKIAHEPKPPILLKVLEKIYAVTKEPPENPLKKFEENPEDPLLDETEEEDLLNKYSIVRDPPPKDEENILELNREPISVKFLTQDQISALFDQIKQARSEETEMRHFWI